MPAPATGLAPHIYCHLYMPIKLTRVFPPASVTRVPGACTHSVWLRVPCLVPVLQCLLKVAT